MPKILIFGLGAVFTEHVRQINFDDVAGLSDNSIYRVRGTMYGKYCFPPDRIRECSFDYAVIFNQAHSREIRDQLVSLGVGPDKIVSWQHYLFRMCGRTVPMSRPCLAHVAGFVRDRGIRRVLDVGGSLARNGLRGTEDWGGTVELSCLSLRDAGSGPAGGGGGPAAAVRNPSGAASLWGRNLYSRTVGNLGGRYGAVVCLDFFLSHRPGELASLVKELEGRFRYLVVSSPFPYPEEFTEWADFDFSSLGTVSSLSCRTVMLHFIDTARPGELRMVTVAHRPCSLPDSPLYLPVFAGGGSCNPLGIQGDADGDSISRLNPKINELTALYWAWKNTDYPYLGLCHYRRYFADVAGAGGPDGAGGTGRPFTDGGRLLDMLSGCDMLVDRAVEFWPLTIRDQLALTVRADALEEGLALVRDTIARVQPDYLSEFDEYLDGGWMYPCNMFVTSRPLLDSYCGWLFSIIVPAAEQFDASGYDGYSARTIGFIAERLLTLWVLHNGVRVRELPVVQTEP